MTSVDLHAHLMDRESLERLAELGPHVGGRLAEGDDGYYLRYPGREPMGPLPVAMFDVERRLGEMDDQGVDVQVLAVPPSELAYHVDPVLGSAIAAAHNDAAISLSHRYPERFWVFATVPLQDPAATIRELERVAPERCVRGVEIGTNVNGANLDAPELDPVWDALQAFDLAVWVHPDQRAVAGADRLGRYYLRNLVGNPLETTIAVASLVFGGVLHRFPSLRFGFVHGGGFVPYQLGRWDHGWRRRAEVGRAVPEQPSGYVGRMYFDSLTHDRASLELLGRRVGWRQVVLGSDYPFDMGDEDPVGSVRALALDPVDEAGVLAGNAERLLRPVSPGGAVPRAPSARPTGKVAPGARP